ncbi:helix-turn-helix domain-containing protein [Paenibacillus sp. MY03]|uniref:helix-turn-helix domain-containing protein n=1 Tax=Paenibacillus sp. MY03 TaxID=302980 RepID=UPI0015C68391|nr:helix-turn-helix domain-containing protein [Paenibacillus sp. MY03]
MRINRLNRIQLSYLPVFFVISLSLLFIAYLTLSEVSKQSAHKANNMLAHNVMQMIDNSLQSIDLAIDRQLLENDMISLFFQETSIRDRQYWDYRTAIVLNELLESHPLIDSIYLYRTRDNMVLSPTTFIRLDEFGDKQFVGRKLSSLQPFRWTSNREYREQSGDSTVDVVSLVKYANLSDRSLVVVNVSTERLSHLIRGMTPSGLNYFELSDVDGGVVATRDWPNATKERWRERPESGAEWSNAQSEYTGWTVRSGVYEGGIMQWVSTLFYVWITLGFLTIAGGIIWLIFVTRRNYRPIQMISQRMTEYFQQKRQELTLPDRDDELKYIETAVNKLLDQSSLLLEQNKENLAYRKRHVFLQLLEGAVSGQTIEWRQEVEQFGGAIDHSRLLVAIVEIDGYQDISGKYTSRDLYLLKHVMYSALDEMAETETCRVWSEWIERHQLGVLFIIEHDGNADEQALSLMERLKAWVNRHLPYTVTVGVGNWQEDAANVVESYESALEALNYKASLGMNRIIKHTDIAAKPPLEILKQSQRVRAVGQSFRSGEVDWERHWHELFEEWREQLFTKDELLGMLNYLIYQLHKEISELPKEFQTIWNDGPHAQLNGIMGRQETLDTIQKECFGVLQDTFRRMSDLRESKHNHHLIRGVKQYIHEHYNDSNLSHAHLEKEFGLTASYLSRLFKEEFGVKFIDYLSQTRIEKAIELLKAYPDKTVQSIAEEVGYMHGITFIRAFKKYTGSTPGNYRKDLIP